MDVEVRCLILLLALLLTPTLAAASMFTPITPEQLAAKSIAVVVATVTDLRVGKTDGAIRTQVDLTVEQSISGPFLAGSTVTLTEMGGTTFQQQRIKLRIHLVAAAGSAV